MVVNLSFMIWTQTSHFWIWNLKILRHFLGICKSLEFWSGDLFDKKAMILGESDLVKSTLFLIKMESLKNKN